GCGSASGVLRSTLHTLVPWSHNVSKRAASLPYASIDLTVGGKGGLVVLAELSEGNAYFQSASRGTIDIRHGYLAQSAGLPENLLMTRVYATGEAQMAMPWRTARAGEPFNYIVQRMWRTADGMLHTGRANATLVCKASTKQVELPLA